MKVLNRTQNTVIAENATLADTFVSRMVGLLRHARLEKGEGLIITHCNSIHMFFMKFAIDVIFIDKKDQVVGLVPDIPPNRLSKIYFSAVKAIEVPVGVIQETRTAIGDTITVQ